jgi:hypothetical protein
MNCRELQSYFEAHGITGLASDRLEVTEHMAGCANCRQFVQTRNETLAQVRLLGETAPPIPASLDAAVLANYRRQIEARTAVEASPVRRLGFAYWRWRVAVAAGLVIVATVFVLRKPSLRVNTEPRPTPPPAVAQLPQPSSTEAPRPVPTRKVDAVTHRVKPRKLNTIAADHALPVALQSDFNNSLPDGFRSLMYCDELSCDGGMEVVRVQLPSPAAGFLPSAASGNHVVSADVLVGADGFARGIRIVH